MTCCGRERKKLRLSPCITRWLRRRARALGTCQIGFGLQSKYVPPRQYLLLTIRERWSRESPKRKPVGFSHQRSIRRKTRADQDALCQKRKWTLRASWSLAVLQRRLSASRPFKSGSAPYWSRRLGPSMSLFNAAMCMAGCLPCFLSHVGN